MTLPLTSDYYERLDWFYFWAIVKLISFPHIIIRNTFLTLFINNLVKDNTGKKSSLVFYNCEL